MELLSGRLLGPLAVCMLCLWLVACEEESCETEPCYCSRRLRLENSSGVIVDRFGGDAYGSQNRCLFYLESDRPMSSVRLKFNSFNLECLWDYLYIFSGDSLHCNKIAAFTGDLLLPDTDPPTTAEPTPIPMIHRNTTNDDGSGSGSPPDPVLIPYQEPRDIVLDSPGSSLLLYFFTDTAVHKSGFNISYWLNYSCPEDCLGRGNCSEEGECECGEEWTGEWCQLPVCPNDCFGSDHGVCVNSVCHCSSLYTGVDCSVSVSSPQWHTVNYTTSSDNLTSSLLARAGHSSLTIFSDTILIYGGYRFPINQEGGGGGSGSAEEESSSGSGSGDEEEEEERMKVVAGPQLLLYDVVSGQWEVPEVNQSNPQPSPRYGHSAVLYNDTVHVFGGVLIPEESITNEHWTLHLPTLTWSLLTLPSSPISPDYDVVDNSTNNNNLTGVSTDSGVVVTMTNEMTANLPIRVRSHTAHVVGTTMIVIFGMSDLDSSLINFVQEYDLELGVWSIPSQYGMKTRGRMGHSSVYDEEMGLVYVCGGHLGRSPTDGLLTYDPVTHYWGRRLSAPMSVYLHTADLLWGQLMLVFGGSSPSSCFMDQLLIYNIACDTWYEKEYLGLPGDVRRFGHASFVAQSTSSLTIFGGFLGVPLSDMFQLDTGDCSVYTSEEECTNGTVFCGWSENTNSCLSLSDNPTTLSCSIDECLMLLSCDDCMSNTNCTWNTGDNVCRAYRHGLTNVNATCPSSSSSSSSTTDVICGWYDGSCWGCEGAGCQWTHNGCRDSSLNVTTKECYIPCSYSTCSECGASNNDCLWCPSLDKCISATYGEQSYAFTFPFGQCLGYVSNSGSCPVSCESHVTCDDCHSDPECGWCRDPMDTGLGTCYPGGFLSPLSSSSSSSSSSSECPDSDWFFEQCPACQCNGHTTCVNDSVCEECQNNTQGLNCESCANGYYGNATAGGVCRECYCNDYPSSCDSSTGDCMCYDVGVAGPTCSVCNVNNSYDGDPDNFCYYEMSVGFVYTFEVSEPRERESFYLTVPPDDISLSFTFKIRSNPLLQEIIVQLFLGKMSEGLWVLTNLTEPMTLRGTSQFSRELDDRPGSRNSSSPPLFSFAHPRLQNTSNFTDLFDGRSQHDYTSRMWDGNVALIIRVTNLTQPLTFRITLEQTNYWFLLYFFATFIICFTGLLTAFMVGWYLKRKIEFRRYMRRQYRDLRRRVARPFSRVKLVLHRRDGQKKTQPNNSSYVSYQPCKSGKAAILTSFIHLPGDSVDGRPSHGRTGLCLGTALVRLNKSTKERGGNGGGGKGRRRRRKRGEEGREGEEMVGVGHRDSTRNGTVGARPSSAGQSVPPTSTTTTTSTSTSTTRNT